VVVVIGEYITIKEGEVERKIDSIKIAKTAKKYKRKIPSIRDPFA